MPALLPRAALIVSGLALVLALAAWLLRFYPSRPVPERFSRFLMGTHCEIVILPTANQVPGELAERVFSFLADIESKWSVFIPESEISTLNRQGWLEPSPATLELIEKSLAMSRLTDGAFDATVKPLTDAWREADGTDEVPDLSVYLPLVDYRAVFIDGKTVGFEKPGMQFDPGGVAKGMAADLAAEKMMALGVKSGLVNLGGDLRVFGPGPYRGLWRVGIACPEGEGFLGVLYLAGRGLATSGDYYRWFEIGGRRYSHILDPATGRMADPPQSVTVIADNAAQADALATAAAVLGPRAVEKFESLEGVELLLVDSAGKQHRTGGFDLFLSPR